MPINLARLKKDEIVWLYTHRCKHGHRYTEHLPCYEKEKPQIENPIYERIGHLDIEALNLKANFGICFSYAIKEDGGEIIGRSVTPKEMRSGKYDKPLLKELCNELKGFDRITVYYGGDYRYDLPFLRTRCLHYNIPFPLYKDIKVTDVYTIVKKKLCLHRNRLQTVCDFFGIPSKAHPIDYKVWIDAFNGNKKALDYIFEHNKEDVISLEAVYRLLTPYNNRSMASV